MKSSKEILLAGVIAAGIGLPVFNDAYAYMYSKGDIKNSYTWSLTIGAENENQRSVNSFSYQTDILASDKDKFIGEDGFYNSERGWNSWIGVYTDKDGKRNLAYRGSAKKGFGLTGSDELGFYLDSEKRLLSDNGNNVFESSPLEGKLRGEDLDGRYFNKDVVVSTPDFYNTSTSVPNPSTGLLFLSGLAALFVLRRKR